MKFFQKNSLLHDGITLKISAAAHCICDYSWDEKDVISPFSRMYYIVDGKGYLFCQGEEIELVPGNLYFIPLGLHFGYKCDDTLEKVFLHVNLLLENRMDFFSPLKKIINIPAEDLEGLLQEFHSDGIFSKITLKSRVYKDLYKVAEKGLEDYSEKSHGELVKRTLDYININLSVKLKIKKIAEALFVSQSQLVKKFNEEMKIGIGGYIDKRIIFESEKMIAEGCSIDSISEKFEFCDRFYFTRRFKEQTGMTPGEYKRQIEAQLRNGNGII